MRHMKMLGLSLVVVFAVTPAAAQAMGPHWWFKEVGPAIIIPEGEVRTLTTSGNLVFHVGTTAIKCKVTDEETIENPIGGEPGEDEMTAFNPTGCKGKKACPPPTVLEIEALNLGWPSHLIAGIPIRDEIEGVELESRCSGTQIDVFEGTLTPAVGNNVLKFGPGSGELEDAGGNKATVTGADKLVDPSGAKIKAKP